MYDREMCIAPSDVSGVYSGRSWNDRGATSTLRPGCHFEAMYRDPANLGIGLAWNDLHAAVLREDCRRRACA